MASYESYKTDDGRKRILAVVRIKGFKRVSQAFDQKRDAEEWAAATEKKLRGERDRGGARTDIAHLTLRELASAFLADPKTKALVYAPELARTLGAWCDAYGATRLRSFGRIQVIAFRDKLLGTGLSPARVNRYLSAMRRAWNWGTESGYTAEPWPRKIMLEEPKPEEILERYGTGDATLGDIAEVIAVSGAEFPALGNLVGFLIGTGARLGDALAVRWRDIDINQGDVAIRGQKTGKPLRVAMLAPAVTAIARQGEVKNLSGMVFWQLPTRHTSRNYFENARKKFPAHLQRMRLHDCRHLCASLLAANGATDVELAAQLGHSTLQMVKRYAHLRGGHRGAAHDKLDKAFGAQK